MTESLHARLVAARIPRQGEIVDPYVARGTAWARQMTQGVVGMLFVLSVLAAIADTHSGKHTMPVSFLLGFGYMYGVGSFFLAPLVIFWLVHRARLRELLRQGELRPGTIIERGAMEFRGTETPSAAVEYTDALGHVRRASFQAPQAQSLRVGDSVQVIADRTTSVALLWAPDGLVLARRR